MGTASLSARILLFLALPLASLQAQVGAPAARVSTAVEMDGARVGTQVRLALRVTLPARFHVQSDKPRDKSLIPTLLVLAPPAGVKISEIVYPESTDLVQAGVPQPLAVFGSDFVIGIRATIASDANLGPMVIRGKFRYQACDDKVCYAPTTQEVLWMVRVVSATTAVNPQSAPVFGQFPGKPDIAVPTPDIVTQVRAAIDAHDMARGEQLVGAFGDDHGMTPEFYLALSWLGRGYLAASQLDKAEQFARQTYVLGLAELGRRPMDQEPNFPTAFGAAIEVLGQVAAARGARTEAVSYLTEQLHLYENTSIAKRIQKNLNLVSLEGTPAPALDLSEVQGVSVPTLESLKGKVVLLFFWAHWCPDCKEEGPILERLAAKYGSRGLAVVAPTQRFGYVAEGRPATAEAEARYIAQVREAYYPWLAKIPVPLSENNYRRYGVSTTPTLVLVDRTGIVRLYKPGKLSETELDGLIQRLL